MFEDMDSNRSGTLSRKELKNGLALLGRDIDEEAVAALVEDIDVDYSKDIDAHEFSNEGRFSDAT